MSPSEEYNIVYAFHGVSFSQEQNCHVFGMWPFSCDYGELSLVRNVASAQREKNLESH